MAGTVARRAELADAAIAAGACAPIEHAGISTVGGPTRRSPAAALAATVVDAQQRIASAVSAAPTAP